MIAIFVLLFAALSRLVPHEIHSVAFNFTAVGAGLLYWGSRGGSPGGQRRPLSQMVLAVAVMGLMDVYLTTRVYHYPFHVRGYLVTWAWYAAVCLMGSVLLRKVTVLRVVAGVLASSTSFFLLSNFMVWAGGHMYPRTAAGLGSCYVAGLPFYGNDLMSTAIFAAAFFGLPALAARMSEHEPAGTMVG